MQNENIFQEQFCKKIIAKSVIMASKSYGGCSSELLCICRYEAVKHGVKL